MSKALIIKDGILASLAIIGSFATSLLGGWDKAMQTLIILMTVDYLTGLLIAAVWNKSPKSANGALESKAAGKGLIRKGMYIFAVLVACQVDQTIGLNDLARNATIYGFLGVEGLSIVENMGIMGVPMPPVIKRSFELLKKRGEQESEVRIDEQTE